MKLFAFKKVGSASSQIFDKTLSRYKRTAIDKLEILLKQEKGNDFEFDYNSTINEIIEKLVPKDYELVEIDVPNFEL